MARFDPGKFLAPLVIGHKELDRLIGGVSDWKIAGHVDQRKPLKHWIRRGALHPELSAGRMTMLEYVLTLRIPAKAKARFRQQGGRKHMRVIDATQRPVVPDRV